MTTRACCYNCGFVGNYKLPYHAKVATYELDENVITPSTFTTDDGKATPFICDNCGRPELEIVYWDGSKKADPLTGIRITRA